MSNRRDFLKLFGIGAAIAPIIGGVPMMEAESIIIKPPTVEPITFLSSGEAWEAWEMLRKTHKMMVTFTESNGTRRVFETDTFCTHINVGNPQHPTVTWELKGKIVSSKGLAC